MQMRGVFSYIQTMKGVDMNKSLFLQARKYLEDRHASAVEEASHPCFGYTQEVRDEYDKRESINMKKQNITLPIGKRGHMLSIAQGVGGGSLKGFQVEVALLDTLGQFVNSGQWWVDATYQQKQDDYYDDVVSGIDADDLQWVIAKARKWVGI